MEPEIDLRPYIVSILRRWRMIALSLLGLMVLGVALAGLTGGSQSASADVLIVPITSQVTLDTRFQTTNGNQATTPAAQRQALISLANSQTIAKQVVQELAGTTVDSTSDSTQALLDSITVASSSDLLRITVNDPDPARALAIAEAWGKAYESLVADVYTRSQFRSDLLESEITDARQRYDLAQQELEVFLGDGQLIQLERQISQLTDLLVSSRKGQQLLYSEYLTRTRELDLVLADAQTLRDQARSQDASGFAESLAALLLRARTVDSEAPIFQLNAADIGTEQEFAGSSPTDLDQLITVLARRREELLAQANDLAAAIADGSAGTTGLDPATQQRYIDQLASLKSNYEQLQARQTLLTQQRDLARDTLLLLQRKRDEQQVSRSSPQIEVRFVSANLDPPPSVVGRMIVGGLAAAFVGLLFGVLLALLLDIFIPALRRMSRPEPIHPGVRPDTPADRAIPGN